MISLPNRLPPDDDDSPEASVPTLAAAAEAVGAIDGTAKLDGGERPRRRRTRSGLPRVAGGRRRRWVIRLILYGLIRVFVVLLLACLVRYALRGPFESASPVWSGLGALALTWILFFLRVVEARDGERLGQDYVMRVRQRLLSCHTQRAGDPTSGPRPGVIFNRLIGDLNSLRQWVSLGFARMVSAGVTLGGLLIVLGYLHTEIAVWFAVVVGLAVGFGSWLTPRLRARIRQTRRQRGRLANRVADLVLAGPAPRLLGWADGEIRRVERLGRHLARAVVRRAVRTAVLRRSSELAHGLALAGLLFLGLRGALSEHDAVGGAAAVFLILGMIVSALGDLARAWSFRLAFEEAERRLRKGLSRPARTSALRDVILPGEGPVGVRLEDVEWDRRLGRWSAEVLGGERVLVSGTGGSGKTTLLRLLSRTVDLGPGQGRVLLDGVPLAEIRGLEHVVQWVSNEVPLRRGTIRRNLPAAATVGTGVSSDALLLLLGLTGDRGLFPNGLETGVADAGANLSATARARVQLARALLFHPRVLLIDEPVFLTDSLAGDALRRALEFTRATVFLVGTESGSPLEPDAVWHLSPSGIRVSRPDNRVR